MTASLFYVYVHRKKTNGDIFYVGKGSGTRYLATNSRNRKWHNFFKKYGLCAEILQYFEKEEDALSFEVSLIKSLKENGISLTNITKGGEGIKGYLFTPEQKVLLSKAQKCNWEKEGYREKHRIAMRLVFSSDSYKLKQSLASKRGWNDPKSREKRLRGLLRGGEAPNAKPVTCIETGRIFKSMSLAVSWLQSLGFASATSSQIAACCQEKAHSYCGYHWHFIENLPDPIKLAWIFSGYAKGGAHYRARKVICCETGVLFSTMTEAQKWLLSTHSVKVSVSEISDCCNFKQRHTRGFHFIYAGYVPTEPQLKWMYEGRPSGGRSPVARPVQCKETGHVFETLTAATAWVRKNINPSASLGNIASCCRNGIPKTAYGFRWAYCEI